MSGLHPIFQQICDDFGFPQRRRPEEPSKAYGTPAVWYRGWECGYDATAAYWGAEDWIAYKGGCDLDAPQASGRTWSDLLDEIDAEEAA